MSHRTRVGRRLVYGTLLVVLLGGVFGASFLPPLASDTDAPFVVVLGVAQDAGFPQAGCKKDCCAARLE